jgi:hypothetical protein
MAASLLGRKVFTGHWGARKIRGQGTRHRARGKGQNKIKDKSKKTKVKRQK